MRPNSRAHDPFAPHRAPAPAPQPRRSPRRRSARRKRAQAAPTDEPLRPVEQPEGMRTTADMALAEDDSVAARE